MVDYSKYRGCNVGGGQVAGGPFGGNAAWYPVSQAYGWVNGDHSTGPNGYAFHYGLDIQAPEGTPLVAMGYGVCRYVSDNTDETGNAVMLVYEDGTVEHQYYHMRDAALVRPGQVVTPGQIVGYVGTTGNSTGPHLHFGLYYHNADGSTTVNDPSPFLAALNDTPYVPPAPVVAPPPPPPGPFAAFEYLGTAGNWWTHRWRVRMQRNQLGAWQGTFYQGVQNGEDVWYFEAEDWQ